MAANLVERQNENRRIEISTTEARQAVSVGVRYVLAVGLLLATAAGFFIYLAFFH